MKQIVYLILILFILAVSESLLSFLKISNISPNLLALLVVAGVLFADDLGYLWLAFFSGLFLDFFSPAPIGTFSLGFLFSAGLINLLSQKVFVFQKDWKFAVLNFAVFLVFLKTFVFFYSWLLWKIGLAQYLFNREKFVIDFVIEYVYSLLFFYPVSKCYLLAKEFIKKLSVN